MTQTNRNFEGYLGLILGSTVGALLYSGVDLQQIHDMIELSARAYEAEHDPRIRKAAQLLTDVAQDLQK